MTQQALRELVAVNKDAVTVRMALGFLASAIICGEDWTPICQQTLDEADAALSRLSAPPLAESAGDDMGKKKK